MNWKIGDRAINTKPGGAMCGLEVIIMSELRIMNAGFKGVIEENVSVYVVDPGFPVIGAYVSWVSRPEFLKPIPDTYDGNEATTWDECPFKPAKELTL